MVTAPVELPEAVAGWAGILFVSWVCASVSGDVLCVSGHWGGNQFGNGWRICRGRALCHLRCSWLGPAASVAALAFRGWRVRSEE